MAFRMRTSYLDDLRLVSTGTGRATTLLLLGLLLIAPWLLGRFLIGELSLILIYGIASTGLMLLVGYTGQLSLGHGAFLGIGAYAHALLLNSGVPLLPALMGGGLCAAVAALLVALAAVRMSGIYVAIVTLTFSLICEQVLTHWRSLTGGFGGMSVLPASAFGMDLSAPGPFYLFCLLSLALSLLAVANLLRGRTGRAWIAIRESEMAARTMGIRVTAHKILAFGVSGLLTGIAGGLFAHHLGYLSPDAFRYPTSVLLLMMVVVGGLGSLQGALLGAFAVGLLPQVLAVLRETLPPAVGGQPGLEPGLFGLILILTIVFEPGGLYGRWCRIRQSIDMFPLRPPGRPAAAHLFKRMDRLP
jgi:branched-chain amino acid transport system permease protein